jgi:predicted histidine transporter YuiF (NhaC family)
MRKRVKAALGEAGSPASPTPSKSPTKSSTPTKQSEDVNDTCAYDSKTAATARPYR